MKIIITGAAGGIGSVLSDYLNRLGHELVLVDNLSSGDKSNFVDKNLADKMFQIDVANISVSENLFENADYIIHLSGTSSLPECQDDALACFTNNVNNTIKILEIARKYLCKVIFASTSAVYENNKEIILSEDLLVQPTLNYSLSKFTCENIIKSYAYNYNVNCVALRLFNVFGPNQNAFRKNPPLINYLIRELAQGKNPTIYSDLNQARDYVTVNDVVHSIDILLNKKWFSTFEIYNICSGEMTSIKDILMSLEKSLESKIIIDKGTPDNFWSGYNNIFSTRLPFNTKMIEKELTKSPLGNNSKFHDHFGWKPEQNVLKSIEAESKQMLLKLQNDN